NRTCPSGIFKTPLGGSFRTAAAQVRESITVCASDAAVVKNKSTSNASRYAVTASPAVNAEREIESLSCRIELRTLIPVSGLLRDITTTSTSGDASPIAIY